MRVIGIVHEIGVEFVDEFLGELEGCSPAKNQDCDENKEGQGRGVHEFQHERE